MRLDSGALPLQLANLGQVIGLHVNVNVKGGFVSVVKMFKCDQNLISKVNIYRKMDRCRMEKKHMNNPIISKIPRSLHKNSLHKMFFI